MHEDKSISDFNIKLLTSFALGERMCEETLARKIPRSLPKKFGMKVTTIEKAQDLSSIKIDEFMGFLQTFETNLNYRYENKRKSITFMPNIEEGEDQYGENLSNAIALPDKVSDINPQRKNRDKDKPNRGKGAQCDECERFGHIKYECPTFLKKKKKGFLITWYVSDNESEGEIANKVMNFTGKYDSCSKSSDKDISKEEVAETYKLLLTRWKESCLREKKHKMTISSLLLEKEKLRSTIVGMEEKVTLLKSKLGNMTKFVCMLNNDSDMLDEISEVG